MKGEARAAALRALNDLGVVRASCIHPGYEGLYRRGLASRTAAPGGLFDYRLTDAGRADAKETFR